MFKRLAQMLRSERQLAPEIRLQLVDGLYYPFASLIAGALAGIFIAATIIGLVPTWPLHKLGHVSRMIVSTYQAASGAGVPGMRQLENELVQNAWLTVPADPRILFELPFEERLPSAMETLGINFSNLSEKAGHA